MIRRAAILILAYAIALAGVATAVTAPSPIASVMCWTHASGGAAPESPANSTGGRCCDVCILGTTANLPAPPRLEPVTTGFTIVAVRPLRDAPPPLRASARAGEARAPPVS